MLALRPALRVGLGILPGEPPTVAGSTRPLRWRDRRSWAFTKTWQTVHYSECACGSLGQCGSIGLPSDGPSAFIHPARSRPLASWWMVAPTSALQDFPVPRNLAPEDVAGEVAFLSFRWLTATAPRHSC